MNSPFFSARFSRSVWLLFTPLIAAMGTMWSHAQGQFPANDNFINRTVLTGTNLLIQADNKRATKEPGEPDHAGGTGGSSVWWTWKAPNSGEVRISTDGSSFDTLLAAYVGSTLASLAVVASNDDQGDIYILKDTSRIRFEVAKDTDYQIAVDGFEGTDGNITLSLSFLSEPIPRPPNDNFASRTSLTGTSVTVQASNVNATPEPGEPMHAGEPGDTSVWWTWTAPTAGKVTITTAGSDFDTLLGVYTGPTVSNLTRIASNDDVATNVPTSAVIFQALAGQSYEIAVDGFLWSSGNIQLQITQGQVAVNTLVLSALQMLSNGAVQFGVGGTPGLVSQIQASTNLQSWSSIGSATNRTDPVVFVDPGATNFAQRFYRAVANP